MHHTGEDNSSVGQTSAHPKAALETRRFRGAAPSVGGLMALAVLCGAFFGYALSIVIAPSMALAFVICGAMSFAAAAVVLFLLKPDAPDEFSNGNARTDEEVRRALADIEARKK